MDLNNKANGASGIFMPDSNEDSFDIYDGLDINPRNNTDAAQVKESMDLYEEIVTEERQSRDSSYSELFSRFEVAQNQIKELHRRLEQMELQNTGLNSENYRLKKNISALLRTARQEVTRKDAEIQRLNQRSEKGCCHRESHIKNQYQNISQRSSSGNSSNWLSPPSPSHPVPPPAPPPPPPPPSTSPSPSSSPPDGLLTLPASSTRKEYLLEEPSQPSQKESESSISAPSGASKASSHSYEKSLSRRDSSVRHRDSVRQRYKHREENCQKLKESSDRRHRSATDHNKDCYAPEKKSSSKSDRSLGRRYDHKSSKSRNYLIVEGHYVSDRFKSPPPQILHNVPSSDDKKGRSRERRYDKLKMTTANSEDFVAQCIKESHSRKNKSSEQHLRSSDPKGQQKFCSKQHHECYSISPKDRKGNRLSNSHPKNEDRQHLDEITRKHQMSHSETNRNIKKQSSKKSQYGKLDGCRKEGKAKVQEALKPLCEEPNFKKKISVEENSPNRKLCFMETLNLTLSPIKKPALPSDDRQGGQTTEDNIDVTQPDVDQSSQPDIENMHVIDEIDSSELEAHSKDVVENSTNSPKTPGSEKTQSCEDVKYAKYEKKDRSEFTVANKQLEDHPVQNSVEEKHIAISLTDKSSESCFSQASNEHISRKYEDNTKMASDSQACEYGPLEVTDGVTGSISLQKLHPGNNIDQSVAAAEPIVIDSSVQLTCRLKNTEQKNIIEDASAILLRDTSLINDVSGKADLQSQQISITVIPQDCQQGLCPSAFSSIQEKDTDAVSSTISLESLPQEGLSLPDAIYILTQTNEDANDSKSIASEPSSSIGCIAVSNVSSTTQEAVLPDKYLELTFTPKKSFSPGKSHENSFEPSSSNSLFHDEDSMMHTLSNLKRIPDAISPLRSPIRIFKRSHGHLQSKPGHVKSLEKDFSSTPVDGTSKKLDVNKENKNPSSPKNHEAQSFVDKIFLPSSMSELEEGEILSESDETPADSPGPATKRAKFPRPVRNKTSPKTILKRTSKEKCAVSKETNVAIGVMAHSPKSRFKTVCPGASKSYFSTVEDVMETFKLVRAEIRKKYMKLHKTFPKKSFYGVMDNFRESFLEFVDGAHFGQISSQQRELKSKLNKLIMAVFIKVSNNGIVKRIFEQQATDLKQKLWDFVDVQVDYLFQDIYTTMRHLCKQARAQPEEISTSKKENIPGQPPIVSPKCQQNDTHALFSPNPIKPCSVVPYKTGLGSRGKDIRISHAEKDDKVDLCPTSSTNTQVNQIVSLKAPKIILSTPGKNNISSSFVSQNGSLLDKTDFELLTEQQASSLTFNLVRDTQMGEIFKCLLQGSDLLETTGIAGDNTAWSLGTPRKDGERFISVTAPTKYVSPSKLLSTSKFDTPSKLASWPSSSPCKMSSPPHSKNRTPLNPALFDESCLFEVPLENQAVLQSNLASQQSCSLLAEDLAVSLTIPSPLKSDSHLSFLQPSSINTLATPDSVISAHISEDALLDGEDVTEQDIHLALDTDNSSCNTTNSGVSEILATPFVFKSDQPMQALVMEKSNDHFIVKIRQTTMGTMLTADDSLSKTIEVEQPQEEGKTCQSQNLTDKSQNGSTSHAAISDTKPFKASEVCQTATPDISLTHGECSMLTKHRCNKRQDKLSQQNTSNSSLSGDSQNQTRSNESQKNLLKMDSSDKYLDNNVQTYEKFLKEVNQAPSRETITVPSKEGSSQTCHKEGMILQNSSKHLVSGPDTSPHQSAESSGMSKRNRMLAASDMEKCEMKVLDSERKDASTTPEDKQRSCGKGCKRKKHQEKSKAKRHRKEEELSAEEVFSNHTNGDYESKSSPNSLHAKNVIKKKGEVVISWSRDEDRAILMDLKTKGASRETFSDLSEKLKKPSGQIAQRFHQLMKLYKKQEKMDT